MEEKEMKTKLIFVAMYRALDCLYDEHPSEELRMYLSDANPYIFADRSSADPTVAAEFIDYVKTSYNGDEFDVDFAYDIVKNYLLTKPTLHDSFIKISLGEWKSLCKIIQNEEGNQEQ